MKEFERIYTLAIREHVRLANDGDITDYKNNIVIASRLQELRGCSSVVRAAGLYPVLASEKRNVVGSNPTIPTIF